LIEYAWLIVVVPLLSFIINILFGKKIGARIKQGEAYIVIASMVVSLVIAILVFIDFLNGTGLVDGKYEQSFRWMEFANGSFFELGVLVDNISAFMLLLVSILLTLIAIYSFGYMAHDDSKPRYYAEFSLFAVGMLGTMISNNFLQLLIFWEIMGLCSYLLIGYWYTKPSAASAAKKAFLVTRIGDMMFIVGIIVVFTNFGTLNFGEISTMAGGMNVAMLSLAGLMIFGGTVGKSAQFPMHVWLPDAMEGPTTVSALIHAATMVKAGIFLIARAFPILIHTPDVLMFIAFTGGFTAFFASTMALVAKDIKKILAYSTISQLGYMVLGLGAGGYLVWTAMEQGDHVNSLGFSAALYHLMNHAFFKALLFLGAGSVIHGIGTQNIFEMGGLRKKMKITFLTMTVACFAIAGIFPFSGFWSKDEILAATLEVGHHSNLFLALYVLGVITAFITAFYMFRLLFLTFFGEPKNKELYEKAHESPLSMTAPLVVLAIFSVISGLFLFIGRGFFGLVYFGEPHPFSLEHMFTSPFTYLSLAVAVAGILLAYLVYYKRSISAERIAGRGIGARFHKLFTNKYYMDDLYNGFAIRIVWGFSKLADLFDRHVIDGLVNRVSTGTVKLAGSSDIFDRKVVDGSVNGISHAFVKGGRVLRKKHTGRVQDYAMLIVLGVCAIFVVVFLLSGGI